MKYVLPWHNKSEYPGYSYDLYIEGRNNINGILIASIIYGNGCNFEFRMPGIKRDQTYRKYKSIVTAKKYADLFLMKIGYRFIEERHLVML